MKILLRLAIPLMLLSRPSASASTAEDTTHRPQADFFFCKLPQPILQHPTLTAYDQHAFAGDKLDAADYHRRKEKLGANLAIAGGLGMFVGAPMAAATAKMDSSDGRGSWYVFLGGIALVPVGFALGVTGLTIYGIHRRKRMRSGSHY